MATTLRQGSKGDEVKSLQTSLNNAGYSLDVDGIYGAKTAAAVKDYQTKNALTADGIAGTNTLAKLNGGSSDSGNSPTTGIDTNEGASTPSSTTTKITSTTAAGGLNAYTPSQAVQDAYAKLQATLNNKPAEYVSPYQDTLKELSTQILNRDPFKYDLNADLLYQQYKDQYTNLGQQAMRSTVGDVANMTGGYANSYAATAGNQAYDSYLQELNNKVPELYQLARENYDRDYNQALSNFQVVGELDDRDYSRWADQLSDYYNQANLDFNNYSNAYNRDWAQYEYENNLAYQMSRDAVADAQWNQLHGSGSGSGGSGGSSGSKKTGGGGDPPKPQTKDPTKEQLSSILGQYMKATASNDTAFTAAYNKLASQGVNMNKVDEYLAKFYNKAYEQNDASVKTTNDKDHLSSGVAGIQPTSGQLATALAIAKSNGTSSKSYTTLITNLRKQGYNYTAVEAYVKKNLK